MRRFFLPPELGRGSQFMLDGREAHHALHVLRLRAGEQLAVLDGAGHERLCEVASVGRDSLLLSVVRDTATERLPWHITLLQAIPKGKLIEDIIQKATELGVARIVPLFTERTICHLDAKDAEAKREKWQQVAVEAIKQCGQPWLPKIAPPLPLSRFLAQNERFGLSLAGCLRPGRLPPRLAFEHFLKAEPTLPRNIGVWIGPEGDFTDAEMDAILAAGAQPITFGPLVLRVETAAVYALSLVNYEMQKPFSSA